MAAQRGARRQRPARAASPASRLPLIARAAQLLDPAGEPVAPDEAFWARARRARGARPPPPARARDRRPAVGGADVPRPARAPRRLRCATRRCCCWRWARPELLDVRAGWGEMRSNIGDDRCSSRSPTPTPTSCCASWSARPRSAAADRRAASSTWPRATRCIVVEVVAMLGDDGVLDDPAELPAIAVPPTIQALLDARLDRLRAPERAVIEAAAVEGKEFARESVWALVGDEAVGAHLRELERKDLVRPAGADTYRFRHQLIRDAAYEGIPKLRRALLHVRFADLLAARAPASDELLGYHLESAVRLRRELGEAEAATAALAARASSHLGAAGRRAAQRSDAGAAAGLLERAVALVGNDDAARSALLPALGAALFEAGRIGEAVRVLDEAARSEQRAAERVGARRARAGAAGGGVERRHRARARRRRGRAAGARARRRPPRPGPRLVPARARGVGRRALRPRRRRVGAGRRVRARDGDEAELFVILGRRATAAVLGSTPVDEAIRALRGVPRARGGEPGRRRADGQPARLAARDARRVRGRRRARARGQRDAAPARQPRLGLAPRGARAAARRPARPRRAAAARRAGAARPLRGPRHAGHDRGDARAGAVRAGPDGGGRRAVRRRRRAPRPATTSSRRRSGAA